MSRISVAHYLAASAILIIGAGTSVTACGVHINGTCDISEDCYTPGQFSGWGSMCVEGFCVCPLSETGEMSEPCCSDGTRAGCLDGPTTILYGREVSLDWRCRAISECERLLIEASQGSPDPACEADEECPGPPDARCGRGRCIEGRCEIEVDVYNPMPSQFPGDCKITVCSPSGSPLELFDPGDILRDGNPCTLDACTEDGPSNLSWATKSPCSIEKPMICYDGQCQECADALGDEPCAFGLVCLKNRCVPATCNDSMPNGSETGQDCGGPDCAPCAAGNPCNLNDDCISGVCTGGICEAPTHSDGVKNDGETGIDCGYLGGPKYGCNNGEGCAKHEDCKSAVCYDGICQDPTCFDAVQNGLEAGIDCGDACSSPCPA